MDIRYPEIAFEQSKGTTPSETYLTKLCNKVFLSFWSFSNPYRDEGKKSASGDGTEMCDLLVVFGNTIIILSDRSCEFKRSANINTDWRRWYRKAIYESAQQVWGAENWILSHPDRVFLDKTCKTKFPFQIPSRDVAKIYRIVVAHGAADECKRYFNSGSGSLKLLPISHNQQNPKVGKQIPDPFVVGNINPAKKYVHIFEDITLEIILDTLDTAYDFIQYLEKKENLLLNNCLSAAIGEENLLALYLQTYNTEGKHDFFPDDSETGSLPVSEGLWTQFANSEIRRRQLEENRISYIWDNLIERFCTNIRQGTSVYLDPPLPIKQKTALRFLVWESRLQRRSYSKTIFGGYKKATEKNGNTRILQHVPNDGLYYVFYFKSKKANEDYAAYRTARAEYLFMRVSALKYEQPKAIHIVGVASEGESDGEHSEELIYIDASEWTPEEEMAAKKYKQYLTLLGRKRIGEKHINVTQEYPDEKDGQIEITVKGSDRNNPCPCGSGKNYKKCCGRNSY